MLLYHVLDKGQMFNINSFETASECTKLFGISDIAETVVMRKDRLVKTYNV